MFWVPGKDPLHNYNIIAIIYTLTEIVIPIHYFHSGMEMQNSTTGTNLLGDVGKGG